MVSKIRMDFKGSKRGIESFYNKKRRFSRVRRENSATVLNGGLEQAHSWCLT